MPTGDMKFYAIAMVAALLVSACGDGGSQSAEPPPTAAPVAAAPSPTVAPTVAPAASPTSAPASNIPVPTRAAVRTPTAVPTATPLPTPTKAEALVNAAGDALFEARSWAFNASAVVTGADGGAVRAEMSGDYLDGAFMNADGSAETQDGAFDFRLARFEDARYLMAAGDDGWREMDVPPPFDMFADADALLRADDLRDAGREVSAGGAEMDAVSGKTSPYGSGAEFEALFLFDVQDGALREVRIKGEADAGAFAFALGDSGAAPATVEATVAFSDFGKPIALAAPRMIFAAFGHDAIALADGRAMVLGGASAVANNNVIAPFPIPLPQFYDFADSLWSAGITSAELYDADAGAGVLFPAGVFHSSIALEGGAVMTVGIWGDADNPEPSSLVREFNPDSGEWRTLAGMETARGSPALALLADGALMAAGGLDLEGFAGGGGQPRTAESAEIYDRATDSWRTAAARNGGAASPLAALLALADGRALALAGDADAGESLLGLEDGGRVAVNIDPADGGAADAAVVPAEIYDPETDAWTATARPEISRAEPTAVLLADGRVLVAGAGVERREMNDPNAAGVETVPAFAAEIYDPATDSWTRTDPMIEFRASHTLTLLADGRVLAAGGQDPRASDYVLYATTEIYDPATNAWTAGPGMSEPRMSHSATLLPDGGGVFVAGGIGVHPANGEIYPLNGAEVLDGG